MARLSRRECNDLIAKLTDDQIDRSAGEFDTFAASDSVANEVKSIIASDRESYADLVDSLIAGKSREHIKRRSIERVDEDDLQQTLPSCLANNILMIDSRIAIRMEYATLPMILAAHERRRENTKKQVAALEKWEERILLLKEAGMASDPSMTFGEALIAINGRFVPSNDNAECRTTA